MSPEQCRGAGHVDDKTDVYSLGAIMYQMLAGQPPFSAENDVGVIAMHLCDQPRPLRELMPEVSESLEALIHQTLRKDKTERPSMRAIFEQLAQLEPGRASSAYLQPVPVPPPLDRPVIALPSSSNNPTTMRQSAGQLGEQRRKLPRATFVALLVGVVAVGGAALVSRVYRHSDHHAAVSPSAPALAPASKTADKPATPVARIRWEVTTVPAGAEVVRAEDHERLGTTPWQLEQASETGTTTLILRAPGYAERSIVVDRGKSGTWQESLEQLAPPTASAPPPSRSEPPKLVVKGAPKRNPCPADNACSARAQRAMDLYNAKHYDQALREFQTAYTMTQDAPRLLIHIGLCIAHMGQAKQALQYYQSYLRAEPNCDADTRTRVNSYMAEAKAALAASH